ncbi:hypothetical protein [Lentilactobacillus sp. Marseille-Q4993]|uniref:hypothetical protein n=1 Tax=Lentilactobacillus sp. Marseille-Q4993 TaxID=3039492 RepID=UPI0024BC20FA|nr:hypothetical protein [Lentilactobacillus sp. Marseille-Q4993]
MDNSDNGIKGAINGFLAILSGIVLILLYFIAKLIIAAIIFAIIAGIWALIKYQLHTNRPINKYNYRDFEFDKVANELSYADRLDSTSFTYYVAKIFIDLGYQNVTVTPSTDGNNLIVEGQQFTAYCIHNKNEQVELDWQPTAGKLLATQNKQKYVITNGTFEAGFGTNYRFKMIDRTGLTQLLSKVTAD